MTTRHVAVAKRDGATFAVDARRPLLDTVREPGVDLQDGCKFGGEIICAAKFIAEKIDPRRHVALNNRPRSRGDVILCVARPVSGVTLKIGVESHGQLYRTPFHEPLEPHALAASVAASWETRGMPGAEIGHIYAFSAAFLAEILRKVKTIAMVGASAEKTKVSYGGLRVLRETG